MSDSAIPKKDADEAKRRAEWLHKHKAHKDWIILSVSEVAVIRNNLLILERERDEARDALMKIEDRCVDGEDACDDIVKIRDIAVKALEGEK